MFRKNERCSIAWQSNQSKKKREIGSNKQSFHLKVAWATNKGVKDRFKEYWDTDQGCTYIPYSEIKHIPNLSALAEGGTIDEESMPSFLKRLCSFLSLFS